MGKRRAIYFNELTQLKQNLVLDAYGAGSAAELGLDREPLAVIDYNRDGSIAAVELSQLVNMGLLAT